MHPGLYRLARSDQRSQPLRCRGGRRSLGGAVGWSLRYLPSSTSHVTARAGQVSSKDATLPLSPPAGAELLFISRRCCWESATAALVLLGNILFCWSSSANLSQDAQNGKTPALLSDTFVKRASVGFLDKWVGDLFREMCPLNRKLYCV